MFRSVCRKPIRPLKFHLRQERQFRDDLEQVALARVRAARVSTDETQLAAWPNAVDAG